MNSSRRIEPSERCHLYALPIELAQKISNCLLPIEVRTADELSTLMETYPLQYLAVHVRHLNDPSWRGAFTHVPEMLKEVVVGSASYLLHGETVDLLLQLQLECLSMDIMDLDDSNFKLLVDKCCESPNKHHAFCFSFKNRGSDEEHRVLLDSQIVRLMRDDKALLSLKFGFDKLTLDFTQSGLLCTRSELAASTLQHLSIYSEFSSSDHFEALSNALARNCSLVTLYLRLMGSYRSGLALLADGIADNTVLLSLQLFYYHECSHGDTDVQSLANALARNQTLETLVVQGVECKDEESAIKTASAIGNMLKVNRALVLLDLSRCYFRKVGCRKIVNAVEQNESLEALCLYSCGLTDPDKERLRRRSKSHNKNEVSCHVAQVFWDWHNLTTSNIYRAHQWRLAGDKTRHRGYNPYYLV